MTVPYCFKEFIFIIVAILLLIDNTNLAKGDYYEGKDYNYDKYQYPDYEYPDRSSTYGFHFVLLQIKFKYILLKGASFQKVNVFVKSQKKHITNHLKFVFPGQ